ncbi:hypothetical protein JL09_g6994 [Pichia kudriavzevii]|uniref:Uncharacterized protein n=1 Tax=Pichia kudriavzevii TaxID=4909 RepID=A0A099NJZ3_PICKU|nr:hypothetical protein JL09_g6994 [Pichia kudriavzevii]
MPKQQSRPPYHEMNPFYARITNIVRNKDQYMHFEVELDSWGPYWDLPRERRGDS